MYKKLKSVMSLLLVIVLLISCLSNVSAAENKYNLDDAIKDTAKYVYNTVKVPQVGSIGGEWAILGLARSGYKVPDKYYQDYLSTVEKYVAEKKGDLHSVKYTEYSRLIVALTSIGSDPTSIAGYNLLTPLGDYDKTIRQGLNGPIWALMALDSGDYSMPVNTQAKTQASREMYIKRILECQLNDGGFSLFGGTSKQSKTSASDPDITGMALQALAKYQDKPEVKKVIDEAVECLSKIQGEQGGYYSWGAFNSESCVQVICALTELGIPLDDPRFVKNGNTVLDALMTFYLPGNGFLHVSQGSGSNLMATEQGFYGMIAAQRSRDGKPTLYRMTDPLIIPKADPNAPKPGEGLKGKHADIKTVHITDAWKTFDDISGANAHDNMTAIEGLAARQILSGKSSNTFDPNGNMTRAEFCAVIVKALGLEAHVNSKFKDVPANSWYASYVGSANKYGIVNGTSDTTFYPMGTITRQEAAVMVANAAKLCGLDTNLQSGEMRDMLAQFDDYVETSTWARDSLAICYKSDILNQNDISISPRTPIKRCEAAQMIYNLLAISNLL